MIKNVVLDLGAVLLDIDLEAFKSELKLIRDENQFQFNHEEVGLYGAYERGELSTEAFFETLAAQFSGRVELSRLQKAWAMILKEPIPESIQFLQSIQGEYRVFLLSNTNDAHRKQFDQTFDRYLGKGMFYGLFEHAFLSYEMGVIKPNDEIYRKVLDQAGLKATETLFVDDNEANVAAAKNLGIEGWLFGGVGDWPLIRQKIERTA